MKTLFTLASVMLVAGITFTSCSTADAISDTAISPSVTIKSVDAIAESNAIVSLFLASSEYDSLSEGIQSAISFSNIHLINYDNTSMRTAVFRISSDTSNNFLYVHFKSDTSKFVAVITCVSILNDTVHEFALYNAHMLLYYSVDMRDTTGILSNLNVGIPLQLSGMDPNWVTNNDCARMGWHDCMNCAWGICSGSWVCSIECALVLNGCACVAAWGLGCAFHDLN